jgi:hypothetical protein
VLSVAVLLLPWLPIPERCALPSDDVVRIVEAHRLRARVAESVWPVWTRTRFTLLLITPQRELLFGYSSPPQGFELLCSAEPPIGHVYWRERALSPQLVATLAVFDSMPTIVAGGALDTGQSSSAWVITLLHENFHQYQMGLPGYHEAVERLGLSEGGDSGLWMLGYPFPYDDPSIAGGFRRLSRRLAALLRQGSTPASRQAFWSEWRTFSRSLAPQDSRYMQLQLWQEGVARYVEIRTAVAAAREFSPSTDFRRLTDHTTFAEVAALRWEGLLESLESLELSAMRRLAFYDVGAALAVLLELDGESWRDCYRSHPVTLEPCYSPQ